MIQCDRAKAGVWVVDPVLGITGDYASNPVLLDAPNTAQTNAALLLDAPATFNAEDIKLSVLPSFRVGDAGGYSSVASDYAHLNVKGEFDTERSVSTAGVGVARDSSLYENYLLNGAQGVRRDSATAEVNWDRLLTERSDFDVDASSVRVRYGQAAGGSLVDYKYTSITPTLSWDASERNRFTFAASVGRYDSLQGSTESRNGNLQLGFVRQLSEIWSLTASGGYSRSLNQVVVDEEFLVETPDGLAIEVIPITMKSSQNGSVYSVNLRRQGSVLLLNAIASRQVMPTGFAFLGRADTYELKATYSLSARWSLSGDAREARNQNPQVNGVLTQQNVTYLSASASWLWTEHWTLTMAASRVTENLHSPYYNAASNEATITLSRRFDHIKFQ